MSRLLKLALTGMKTGQPSLTLNHYRSSTGCDRRYIGTQSTSLRHAHEQLEHLFVAWCSETLAGMISDRKLRVEGALILTYSHWIPTRARAKAVGITTWIVSGNDIVQNLWMIILCTRHQRTSKCKHV